MKSRRIEKIVLCVILFVTIFTIQNEIHAQSDNTNLIMNPNFIVNRDVDGTYKVDNWEMKYPSNNIRNGWYNDQWPDLPTINALWQEQFKPVNEGLALRSHMEDNVTRNRSSFFKQKISGLESGKRYIMSSLIDIERNNVNGELLASVTIETSDGRILYSNRISDDNTGQAMEGKTSYLENYFDYNGEDIYIVLNSSTSNTLESIVLYNLLRLEMAPDAGDVIVKYVDKHGNKIASSTVLKGKYGDGYTTSSKEIENYILFSTPENKDGNFTENTIEVIYVYERLAGEDITVRYVDEEGNELAESDILSGKLGEDYFSVQKNIANYTIKEYPSNASGIFLDIPQTVTYVYERSTAAPVYVKYVDEEGTELATPTQLDGKVGLPYETEAKSIAGWTVKETPSNAQGTFSEEVQTVTYVYERSTAAPVYVKYVDEEGTELATPTQLDGKVGLPYETEAKSIAGWTVKETPSNAQGTFSEEVQTVTYVYVKSITEIPPTQERPTLPNTGVNNRTGSYMILLLGVSLLLLDRTINVKKKRDS